jgi:hypothetical protein
VSVAAYTLDRVGSHCADGWGSVWLTAGVAPDRLNTESLPGPPIIVPADQIQSTQLRGPPTVSLQIAQMNFCLAEPRLWRKGVKSGTCLKEPAKRRIDMLPASPRPIESNYPPGSPALADRNPALADR